MPADNREIFETETRNCTQMAKVLLKLDSVLFSTRSLPFSDEQNKKNALARPESVMSSRREHQTNC